MSKRKNITPQQREEIVRLRKGNRTLKQIAEILKISINAVHQALKHVTVTGTTTNKIRKTRKRKTSVQLDRIIHRISEANRHKTAVDIHKEIKDQLLTPISTRTIQRRLNEFGLMGRVARKKPLISEKNRKKGYNLLKTI